MSDTLFFTARRPAGPSLNVAFTSTSGSTGAFPQGAQSATIICSVAGWVRVAYGTTQVVATASDIPIAANVPLVVPVPRRHESDAAAAQQVYAAAKGVSVTSAGTMYVQPNAD